MNGMLLVGLGVGAWALYQGKRKVNSMQHLNITINGIKSDFTKILSPKFIVTLDFFNPNDVPLPINSIFGTITDNSGTRLASFSTKNQVSLTAGGTVPVPLVLSLNGLNVVNFFVQAFRQKKLYNMKINGIIKTTFYDQNFSETIIIGA